MITLDRYTFPAEGGNFTLQITKDDNLPWGSVTIPDTAWYSVSRSESVSNYLWEVEVEVNENDSGSSRTMAVAVQTYIESEFFSLTQDTVASLSADIIASSPSGNIPASGGSFTVDVYSNGGNDSLSSASVSGAGCSLVSTTHGVTSGGVTCTRFVFSFAANSSTSNRSATITLQVSNGTQTATETLTKTQAGQSVHSGSLAVNDVSVAADDTSAQAILSLTDIDPSTLQVTSALGWLTSAGIQVSGGSYVLALTFPANTSTLRTQTVTVAADDIYGNSLTAQMTLTQAASGAVTHKITPAWRTALGYDGILHFLAEQEEAVITFTGSFTGDTSATLGASVSGLSLAVVSNTILRITWTGGKIERTRVIPITITRKGDDNVIYSATLNLTMVAGGIFPIWADTFALITSDEDYEDYEIFEGGDLLYAGRAFKYPGEEEISVNLTMVVAPYLVSYYKSVSVYAGDTLVGDWTFVRDYSYDKSIDYSQDQWLNRPINGRVPAGVRLSASLWTLGGVLQVTDGSGSVVVNESVGKGLSVAQWISAPGKSYLFGDFRYEVVDACQAVLLKYVNAYGAMDYFLVEGVSKKQDKISRSTYTKDAAALSSEFETKDYQAEMEAQWTGHTGWLTDAQSALLKHLAESVEVYMVDEQGNDIPVVLTLGTHDYKTFRNNGRKLVNYTLQWSESQKKYRR